MDLETDEGPRYVLPSYEGVVFPPFPHEFSKKVRITLSGKQISQNWDAILREPLQNCYGVPHAKVALMNKDQIRPVRCLWPFFGPNTQRVRHRLDTTYRRVSTGALPRVWAVNFDDGWIKEMNPGARPRGRPKGKPVKQVDCIEAGLDGRGRSKQEPVKKGAQEGKGKQPARRNYSRAPEGTDDENGML